MRFSRVDWKDVALILVAVGGTRNGVVDGLADLVTDQGKRGASVCDVLAGYARENGHNGQY